MVSGNILCQLAIDRVQFIFKVNQENYIKRNWIGNKIEKMLLHNAINKNSLVISKDCYYEKIEGVNRFLGYKDKFAMNWGEQDG